MGRPGRDLARGKNSWTRRRSGRNRRFRHGFRLIRLFGNGPLRRLQQNRPDGNLFFFDPVKEETRLLARFRFLNQPVLHLDRHDHYVFPLPGRFQKADDLFDGNFPLFDFAGNHDPPARDGESLLDPETKTAHCL